MVGAVSDQKWTLSRHAARRMEEMGVPLGEVLATVNEPQIEHPSRTHPHCTVRVRGRLAVPVARDAPVIITVLWNGKEGR